MTSSFKPSMSICHSFHHQRTSQHGFTLVELAIVMTIIGLLIGGILKGQELMMNARVTATIAQVKSYQAAKIIFTDTYEGIPGDFAGADTRLQGCDANCVSGFPSSGDGILGNPPQAGTEWGACNIQYMLPSTGVGGYKEPPLFWLHLVLADLISGVSPEALTATTTAWGITHPASKMGGGYIVCQVAGFTNPPGGAITTTRPSGIIMALVNSIPDGSGGIQPVQGTNILTAKNAAVIDRKMDDGRPASGFVYAFGFPTSCVGDPSNPAYNERATGNDCGLIFEFE